MFFFLYIITVNTVCYILLYGPLYGVKINYLEILLNSFSGEDILSRRIFFLEKKSIHFPPPMQMASFHRRTKYQSILHSEM